MRRTFSYTRNSRLPCCRLPYCRLSPSAIAITYYLSPSPTAITHHYHPPIAIAHYYRPSLFPTNPRYSLLVMAMGDGDG